MLPRPNAEPVRGHETAHGDRRRLAFALALAIATLCLEVIGAALTGSLALLADAGHVLADAFALTLALFAASVAARPHTLNWTFGYHRAEVLAAAVNALALLGVGAFIVWQAIQRLIEPSEVHAGGLFAVALVGLGANLLQFRVLRHSHSMNVRAARLHVLFDLAGSVAAVSAGVLVAVTGQPRVDAVLSLVIVALVAYGALRLLREAGMTLMARVPNDIDLREVDAALRAVPGVLAVHDLHCWAITTDLIALTCHLQLRPSANASEVTHAATDMLRERFGIGHITIQAEPIPLLDPSQPPPEAPAPR